MQYHIRETENDEYIHVISFECCTRLLGLVVTSKVKDNIRRLYSNEKSEIIFYMRYISIDLWADRYFLNYLPHDFNAELQVRQWRGSGFENNVYYYVNRSRVTCKVLIL